MLKKLFYEINENVKEGEDERKAFALTNLQYDCSDKREPHTQRQKAGRVRTTARYFRTASFKWAFHPPTSSTGKLKFKGGPERQ